MRNSHFTQCLAGTALALVLAVNVHPAFATDDSQAIEAAIPVPEPANMPPLTAADVKATGPNAAAASTPADKPALAASLSSADLPIAERLRDVATGKFDRMLGKRERAAVDAFYAARGYAPLWITDGSANERAKAAIAHLRGVEADALDPSDYPTPDFKVASDPAALADAEVRLTASVLTYARHAQVGRIHFSRISADIYYPQETPETTDVLAKIAGTKDVGGALASFNPQQKGYQALKAKLAEAWSSKREHGPARIAGGPVLKVGKTLMQDPRVPQLRERLGGAGDADNKTYDKPLAEAVAKFQRQHGLSPSGHLNSATIDAMNGPRRDRDADIIIANMERWRWLPRDLGKTYVMLNIPDYTLKVVRNDVTLWQTRVVVGKPNTPTPLLSETMKYITINPTWNVPPSIVYNEYLPALQQDPTVLERMGLRLEQNRDGSVHISQPPGERNALGRIRFNFPNKFLVYQHDTPDKHLFAHDKRAYSHGCMRVQDPVKYAELLLSLALPNDRYTQDRIRGMFGSAEHDIRFPTPIPVHITYQTAFVDDAGKLQVRDDVYGRDSRVMAALRGDERRVADVAVERPQPNYSRPSVRLPASYSYAGNGGSFFDRLFGGGPAIPPAPVFQRRIFTR